MRAASVAEVRRHLRQRVLVELDLEALGAQVRDRLLGRRLRRAVRERPHRGAHERRAEPRRLEVDERRHRGRAVRVHLERQRRGGGAQRGHERAHALGREQAARVLEVEHVHVGARGDLARASGVVVVGVNRADAVDEADQHLRRRPPASRSAAMRRSVSTSFIDSATQILRMPLRMTQARASRMTSTGARCQAMKRMPGVMKPSGVSGISARTVRMRSHGSSACVRTAIGHVGAAREVDRVEADAVHHGRDLGDHRRRQRVGAPEALVPVAHRRVDEPDHAGRMRKSTSP